MLEEEGFATPRLETDGFSPRTAAEHGELALPPIGAREWANHWREHLQNDHAKKAQELVAPPDVKSVNDMAAWVKQYHDMDHQMHVEMRTNGEKSYPWDTLRIRDQAPRGYRAHSHEPVFIYKAMSIAGNKHAECNGTGNVNCASCGGAGTKACADCDGGTFFACDKCNAMGANNNVVCNKCQGMGGVFCPGCNGHGSLSCKTCKGEKHFPCKGCGGSGEAEGWRLESPIQKGHILPKGTWHFGCTSHSHAKLPDTSECASGIYGYLDPDETRDTEVKRSSMNVLTKGLVMGDILPRDLGAAPRPGAISYDPTTSGIRGVKAEDFSLHAIEHPRCDQCKKTAVYLQNGAFACTQHKENNSAKPLRPIMQELSRYYGASILKNASDETSEMKIK